MSTAVIADDEPHLADYLAQLLSEQWPDLDVVGIAANGREAVELCETHQPDIAFLDIRMPGMDGLEAATRLPESTHVVFVTAYDEYAISAFEQHAFDYLLKPVARERLSLTRERFQKKPQVNQELGAVVAQLLQAQATPDYLEWLRVGYGDTTQLIAVADVLYFRAEHKYTNVVTEDHTHVVRTSIKELEARLDPNQYWRVHRSLIVAVNAIERAQRDLRGRYELTLRGRPEKLRTSQKYGHLFKQM